MKLQIALNVAGGLVLFLLATRMMTKGRKVFAGSGLRHLLGRWTSTPLRGVLSGLLVTGIVQSSSAVTVATIGFVNVGLLTLRQSLGVIFGRGRDARHPRQEPGAVVPHAGSCAGGPG